MVLTIDLGKKGNILRIHYNNEMEFAAFRVCYDKKKKILDLDKLLDYFLDLGNNDYILRPDFKMNKKQRKIYNERRKANK